MAEVVRKKKVIQLSDDEDEEEQLIAVTKPNFIDDDNDDDNDGWEEARDYTKMSAAEIARNKKKALLERNDSKAFKIQKRNRIDDDDNDDDNNNSSDSLPYVKKTKIDYKIKIDTSLLEDTPDIKSNNQGRDELKKRERDHRSRKRNNSHGSKKDKHKKNHRVLDSDGEEASVGDSDETNDEDDDDNDNNSDGSDEDKKGGWKDYDNKGDLQSKAKQILRHCAEVSKNLRFDLSKWGTRKAEEAANKADTSSSCSSSNGDIEASVSSAPGSFCTGLMSIRDSGDDMGGSKVLPNSYFRDICPGLELKAYQLVGVNWLKLLHENNINGVLADDMGLGKTVQSIAFMAWIKSMPLPEEDEYRKAHLIVVPASTLANWENELRRFCPSLNVVTYHGSQNERAELRNDFKRLLSRGEIDVILSTFTIFERESCKEDRSFIYKQRFEYVIIDEAHCLKVSTSSRFVNLNAVKSRHRLLLSGTPVQNDLSELLALMSFLMPKVFGSINIVELLEGFGWDKKSGVPSTSSSAVSINQLRNMLSAIVLRRVKSDVLDQLVDKESAVEKVTMTAFQSSVYDNILFGHARRKVNITARVASESLAQSIMEGKMKKKRSKESKEANKEILDLVSPPPKKTTKDKVNATADSDTMTVSLLENTSDVLMNVKDEDMQQIVHEMSNSEANHLFTALRKAANNPLLLRVRYQDENTMKKIADVCFSMGRFGYQCDLQRVRDEIDKFSDFDLHQLCLEYFDSLGQFQLDSETLYASTKMQLLKEMLPRLAAEGHRMLVFSQWTRLLDLLEVLLYDIGMRFLRLDGSTPVKDRQYLIDEFSAEGSDIPVFLLSTKAGGLGINLTAADTVIMHDLDFNPENDRQAEDRCHRIGQTKAVKVYRLVTIDTVDEDIYEMGERKRKLTAAVLSDHHASAKKGGKRGKDVVDGEGDIGQIGRILQKALMRNKVKAQEGLNSSSSSSSSDSSSSSGNGSSDLSSASNGHGNSVEVVEVKCDEVIVNVNDLFSNKTSVNDFR